MPRVVEPHTRISVDHQSPVVSIPSPAAVYFPSMPPSPSLDGRATGKMKKRWRVKSRRSPDQTSPPFQCGEPACQSAEPGSPDRCGEGATSSAPAPDRRGGDECSQNWRGDPSRFHGEETAGRSKRRRKKDGLLFLSRGVIGDALIGEESVVVPEEQRHNASHRSIKISPTGNLCDDLQETGEVSSVPKEESIKRLYLPVRHSSRQSVEAQENAQEKGPFDDGEETSSDMKVEKPKPSPDKYEDEDGQSDKTPSMDMMIADDEEVSCDGEETSSRIMAKKPKPSSGHRGKIAQEEDEDRYPDKTPPSMDFMETISQGEDEQDSKTIGVHAIEEYNQEQGRARVNPYDLLDVDDETIFEKRSYFRKMLNYDSPERDYFPEYEPEELIELYERLALYRIRGYELTVDGKLAALDDVNLKLQYPSSKLYDEGFFQYYEQSLEWYFDPELCKHAHFDDYQRLTLYSGGKYLDWDRYRSTLNTYEEDLAYVQYFEELANETKWIEDYIGDGTYKWTRIRDVVYIQALELAVGFSNVSPLLVSEGFMEHIRCMEFDRSHKGFDALYFEIWKRVAKGKMSFREALLEVHNKDMFPSLSVHIQRELENALFSNQMKYFYDAHFAGIDKMVSEDKARELITEAVIEMRHLYYLDYARKKLNIAKDIGLIPKGRRREVAQQRNGESGEARVESSGDERGCEKGTEALLVQ